MGSGTRRRRRIVVGGIVAVVVVWLAIAGYQLLEARRHAQAGLDRLQETRDLMGPAQLIRGEGLPGLRDARGELASASEAAGSPVLDPLLVLPVVGRQVRSVRALSSSARDVVEVGIHAMERTSAAAAGPTRSGPERVAVIEQLGGIAADASRRLRHVDLGPGDGLVGPLRDARDDFAGDLDRVRRGMTDLDAASRGLTQLAAGPSRYLVLAANNAEMRAGSGMLLSAGVLDVRSGQFELGDMTDTGLLKLPPGAVPMAAGDLRDRWGWLTPNEEWRYLMMSPDFPANAELAARMWAARTGETVDGVLALDPLALRALVAASGPVTVEGKTIDRKNVVQQLLLQQYLDYHGDEQGPVVDPSNTVARREYTSAVAQAVIDRLDQTGWKLPDLVADLSHAADGRHVLAWSSKPEQQQAWEAIGVAGRLTPRSLMVNLSNRGGNKLDQFMALHADLSHRRVRDGVEVTVRIMVRNDTPEKANTFVAGPYPGTGYAKGEYRGILGVDVPGYARDIRLDGTLRLVTNGAEGPSRVVAGDVAILAGARATYTVRFVVPLGYDAVRIEPSARQPAITWTAGHDRWHDSHPVEVTL